MVEMPGSVLKAALENSVSELDDSKGSFLQVAGLRFIFDGRRPVGARVVRVFINDKPLDENAIYKVAITTFLLNGGDGYKMLTGLRPIKSIEESLTESETLERTIRAAHTVHPRVEGRIVRLDQAPASPAAPK
jgi:2',3'-cyclic-nucleotide 2'-phosphodiesterase (5'-nucleotidase family)